jgi:tetratricopeptide (TPR) repeat protein
MIERIGYTVFLSMLLSVSLLAQERNTDYQYALIEAVKQKNLGNLPGAVELYKMVLEENDSVAVAHYELGTLYAVAGSFNMALNHLEKAYEIDPQTHWYINSYIDVLLIQEEFRKAKGLLKGKIKENQAEIEYHYRLANTYFLEDKPGKAIRILNRIEKNWGFSDKVTLLKASIYEENGDFSKALIEIERILEMFPESVELRVVAAEMALKDKNDDLAADYYQGVYELDSTNVYALTNLTDYYRGKGIFNESFFYLNKSFESDEIEYERKAAILGFYLSEDNLVNEHQILLGELVETMLNKYYGKREINLLASEFFIRTNNYNEALNTLKPLLNREEKSYRLWKQGILLANATGRNNDMLMITEIAHEIFRDSLEIIYFKGIAHYEMKQYEEVINTFPRDLIDATGEPEMISQMNMLVAESFYHLNEYDRSDSLFRSIIESEPENFIVMNNFSYYLSLRGESLEEAKALSWKTIVDNPENGTFLDTYAWILYNIGEYEEAEKYIMMALKYGGEDNPVINEHAADILLKSGNVDLARAYYQKAMILGGEKEKLLEKLENIYNGE